jgi:hypothetical protein
MRPTTSRTGLLTFVTAKREREERQYPSGAYSQSKQHMTEAIAEHLKMRVRSKELRNEPTIIVFPVQ